MEVYAATSFLGCGDSASPVRRVLRSPAPPLFMGNSRSKEETEKAKEETYGYGTRRMEVARKGNCKILLFGYFIKLWVYQGWKRRERARSQAVTATQVVKKVERPPVATVATSTDKQEDTGNEDIYKGVLRLKKTLLSIDQRQDCLLNEREDLLETINQLGHKLEQIQYHVNDKKKGISGTRTSGLLLRNASNLVFARYYRKWSTYKKIPTNEATAKVLPSHQCNTFQHQLTQEDTKVLRTHYDMLMQYVKSKCNDVKSCNALSKRNSEASMKVLLRYFLLLKDYKSNRVPAPERRVDTVPQGSAPPVLLQESVDANLTLPVGCSVADVQDCVLTEYSRGERDYGPKFLELHEGFNYERIVWYWWCKWTRYTTAKMVKRTVCGHTVASSGSTQKLVILRDAFRKMVSFAGYSLMRSDQLVQQQTVPVSTPKTPSSMAMSPTPETPQKESDSPPEVSSPAQFF